MMLPVILGLASSLHSQELTSATADIDDRFSNDKILNAAIEHERMTNSFTLHT